jgi:RecQ-mediated genome instability protein 1
VNACVDFLFRELQLDPVLHVDELARQTLTQMLQSDLADSMLRETGFPAGIRSMNNGVIGTRETGGPLLVQVVSITEIGASAFTLANVRQSRLDKADMTGLTKERDLDNEGDAKDAEQDLDEEDVTMPSYPRSMISMMIDDGTTRIKAIEFKRVPKLVLGETPLGCKVLILFMIECRSRSLKLLLRGVRVRNGIAMLEPETVEVVGDQNDDMQQNADMDFLKSLRRRMQLVALMALTGDL